MSIYPSVFTQNLFAISLLLWSLIEFRVLRKDKSKRPKKQDIKSISLFSVLIIIFTIVSFKIFHMQIGMISIQYSWLYWLGISVMYFGIALRHYCVYLMGNQYVATLQVNEKPKLITQGPFGLIRHPCYTGFIIALWGASITMLNYLFIIFLIVFSLLLFLIQIKIEEKQLIKYFGKEYEEYIKSTKKMFPFIY
ncbi:methyltransferase family protein [Bacillus cereus]|uniref:methyltransferase family protein n=1 Tax=Bacillus cereus TaxID=1396 RepID=UPI0015961968|nr:isoprenylcysteine carboxylmethyltransferase family protein [Bacillus cereus]